MSSWSPKSWLAWARSPRGDSSDVRRRSMDARAGSPSPSEEGDEDELWLPDLSSPRPSEAVADRPAGRKADGFSLSAGPAVGAPPPSPTSPFALDRLTPRGVALGSSASLPLPARRLSLDSQTTPFRGGGRGIPDVRLGSPPKANERSMKSKGREDYDELPPELRFEKAMHAAMVINGM